MQAIEQYLHQQDSPPTLAHPAPEYGIAALLILFHVQRLGAYASRPGLLVWNTRLISAGPRHTTACAAEVTEQGPVAVKWIDQRIFLNRALSNIIFPPRYEVPGEDDVGAGCARTNFALQVPVHG